jgi:hypothetical protein
MKQRLAILGGITGIGAKLVELAREEYDIKIYGRPEYNLFAPKTMMVLGRILQRTRPDVFILNASGPIVVGKEQYATVQTDALVTLWPFIKGLDMTLVVMSSAGAWRVSSPADPLLKLFRVSKYKLSAKTLELGWKKKDDEGHLIRTILFEPSTMSPTVAEKANITCLSPNEAWRVIKANIDLRLPFVRVGCQGES